MSKPHTRSPVEPAHSLFGRQWHPLDVFFRPSSVAVIGATESERSVGRATLWNLVSSPFGGTVYPVNPKRTSVLGLRTYQSIRDTPEQVELAIIATPAATVPGLVRECVEAGVSAAIVHAAGFREIGEEGAAIERKVLEEARKGSLRLLGPNCLGVMCPPTGLNATFSRGMARSGSVAFLSQSGALCSAVLDWSLRELVGFSAFVSLGAMTDVGWGDMIDYVANDTRTRSILIYMESVGDAQAFLSAAREVVLSKPIIVIKAGRTPEGARAALAHTGAEAGSDEALEAALRRAGILRVNHISELFYMAEVLGKQPRPGGNRLAIVSNAGGPAVLAADALVAGGGRLAPLAPGTMEALHASLPREWSRMNPVDLLADAPPERYARAIELAAADPNTDGLLVILAPQALTDATQTAERLRAFSKLGSKPLLASWMGGAQVEAGTGILRSAEIPCFPYPDTAARMFLYMWAWQQSIHTLYETPVLDPAEFDTPIEAARAALDSEDLDRLLQLYGIELPSPPLLEIGSFADPQFGPVLYVQLPGGSRTTVLPPLTSTLARMMIARLPGLQLNDEDQALLERTLVRLGRLTVEHLRIRTLHLSAESRSLDLFPPEETPSKPVIRPYPLEYVSTWRLKSGEEVVIRPIRPEDEPLMVPFHQTLSERTVYFRYLSALKLSTRIAHERLVRICFLDYNRQIALVVERKDAESGSPQIVAVGRIVKDMVSFARGRNQAEFALVVSDPFHRQGLGKELLRRLIDIARREGASILFGEISAENQAMQAICRSMGFELEHSLEDMTVVARLRL